MEAVTDIRCFPPFSDGTISYDEMLQYFLSANTLLKERFTHRFEEHTFLGVGAAVCEHCKGMVSHRLCVAALYTHHMVVVEGYCATRSAM